VVLCGDVTHGLSLPSFTGRMKNAFVSLLGKKNAKLLFYRLITPSKDLT
jgi:hypothetical protein